MTEENGRWQGLLGGLRVPIDPRAIFLGMIAFALLMGGVWAFQQVSHQVWGYNAVSFEGTREFLNSLYHTNYWFKGVSALWALLIWALLGGAINRIIAVRLAKDDSIGIGEALAYSRRRFLSYFATPVVLGLIITFLVGCNMLAGAVGWIPYAGPILYILLYILVLLSSLFILILTIGLVFGFLLIGSAISTEGCDGIEASISVYNYIFARPWPYILYHALIAVSVAFLWLAGEFLVNTTLKTTFLFNRTYGYRYYYEGEKAELKGVEVVQGTGGGLLDGIARDLPPYRKAAHQIVRYHADAKDHEKAVKEWGDRSDRWNKALTARVDIEPIRKDVTELAKQYAEKKDAETKKRLEEAQKRQTEKQKIIDEGGSEPGPEPQLLKAYNWMVWDYIRGTEVIEYKPGEKPSRVNFNTRHITGNQASVVRILAWFMFVVVWLLRWLVAGYALTYAFAASTTVYFLLRREVDGTEFEELYEEDEESFDFTEETAAPAETPAAGGAPEPAQRTAEPAPPAEEPAPPAEKPKPAAEEPAPPAEEPKPAEEPPQAEAPAQNAGGEEQPQGGEGGGGGPPV